MKYKITLPKNGYRPDWWRKGDPLEYIVEDGKYEHDYDLCPESIPEDVLERIYECGECIYREYHDETFGRYVTMEVADGWIEKPLGVGSWCLRKNNISIKEIR